MSTTWVAPPLSLVGPAPKQPPHGLFSYLEQVGGLLDGEAHFEAGADFWMYPCTVPLPHDPCAAGTYETKDEGDDAGNRVQFLAFTAYAPMICSTISIGNYDEFAGKIETAFSARESYAAEKELATGSALAGANINPFFGDFNMDLPAGAGAVTPAVGIRWLEYAISLSGAAGVIHAPPAVAAAWRYDELYEDANGVLRTVANDTPVVSGPGYQGADPLSGATPGSGQGWAFATGQVQVRRGETIRLGDAVESIDRSDNVVVVRVERDLLASFDPCIQAGVLIDWDP